MPATTGAFSYLLAPGLRKVFFMHLQDRKKEYEQVFFMTTSKRAYEEHLELAALGSMLGCVLRPPHTSVARRPCPSRHTGCRLTRSIRRPSF